jgi:regulator of sirC expression with transglutaminase-like and TPR domain
VNQVLFEQLGFVREVDDEDLRFQRLAAVLTSKRGSCLGLGALYLALGERLGARYGFSVEGVLVPGHFFVRMSERGAPPTSSCSGAARPCPRPGTAASTACRSATPPPTCGP